MQNIKLQNIVDRLEYIYSTINMYKTILVHDMDTETENLLLSCLIEKDFPIGERLYLIDKNELPLFHITDEFHIILTKL